MKPSYEDIHRVAATAGVQPLWFDQDGVPRFDEFDPDMLGVYDDFSILAAIQCQNCALSFWVGCGYMKYPLGPLVTNRILTIEQVVERFHYGDPPRHGCVGDTMSSITLELLEVWEKSRSTYGWMRRHDLEGGQVG